MCEPCSAGVCGGEAALLFEVDVERCSCEHGMIRADGTHHIHVIFMARTTLLACLTVSFRPPAAQVSGVVRRPTTSTFVGLTRALQRAREPSHLRRTCRMCVRVIGGQRPTLLHYHRIAPRYSAAHMSVTPSSFMNACTSTIIR